MPDDPSSHGRPTGLASEIEAGRLAPPDELRRRLAHGPARFAEGALDNPALGRLELLLLLRNRQVTAPTLRRVAERPEWRRYHAVRAALVLHPHTPTAIARTLVGHLFWKELCEVGVTPWVHTLVRRQAERLLRVRLAELGTGQRITLARRASRGVIGALVELNEPPVLAALLGNPRLVEADAVRLAARRNAPAEALARLAGHPRWGVRRAVRLALVRNARTPVAVALGLLGRLDRRDLRALAGESGAARLVRVGAERMLRRRSKDAGRSGRSGSAS